MDTTDKACALLLGIPPKSLGGIDLTSFTTTAQFKGIRNLPEGWHFIFCSSSNSFSVRHGAWFQVKASNDSPPLIVLKWNPDEEKLSVVTDPTALLQYRANMGQIWKDNLTPYRQSSGRSGDEDDELKTRDWRHLTDCINPTLLDRLLGAGAHNWLLTSASSAAVDADDIPNLHAPGSAHSGVQEEKELSVLPIDLKRTWRPGATGRERTEAARDHSWYLRSVVDEHTDDKDGQEVVGELQFCFLMVLVLNNFSCLEQWKRILSLLFTSITAVAERPALFVRAIRLVAVQIKHVTDAETGMFDMEDSEGKFLKNLLKKFRIGLKNLDDGLAKQDVNEELEELLGFLKSAYGWDLDDAYVLKHGMLQLEDGEMVQADFSEGDEDEEEGEYAPTVVELTEEQLRNLGAASELSPKEQMREEIEEDKIREDHSEKWLR